MAGRKLSEMTAIMATAALQLERMLSCWVGWRVVACRSVMYVWCDGGVGTRVGMEECDWSE